MASMFKDKLGFEHTGREGFISKMRQVWGQYEMEEKERDQEWEKYFQEHGLDCFDHRKHDPRLKELVNKGFPDKYRARIWLSLIGYHGRAMPGYYNDLLSRATSDSSASQDIAQDLDRTFPNHELLQGEEGIDRLRRVLTAFSIRNPRIGYCQSMNFVCFYLLLVLKDEEKAEEKAFWCLVTIAEELFPDYYSKQMIGSQVDLRCFEELMKQNLPVIHARVVIGVLCASWFLCLFGTTLCGPAVCVVWDNIFFRGPHVVMEIGLAIVQQLGDFIEKARSLAEVSKVFNMETLLLDPLPLLLCARSLVPSRTQVQSLRMQHWERITQEIDDLHERRDIRILKERTRFDGAKLKMLRGEFKALSMDGSGITFLQFQQVLNRVLPHWNEANLMPLERIFEVFDEDADKILSFQELMCGLSILYKGTLDEKLTLIFKSFATKDSDYLTQDEALAMFEHVYRTFYHPLILQNPSLPPDLLQQQAADIRSQLTTLVTKAFDTLPPSSPGLDIHGLRQLVVAHPLILECFQPSSTPNTPSMYTSSSSSFTQFPSADQDDPDSLHIVDPPPILLSPASSPAIPPPFSSSSSQNFANLKPSKTVLFSSPYMSSTSSGNFSHDSPSANNYACIIL